MDRLPVDDSDLVAEGRPRLAPDVVLLLSPWLRAEVRVSPVPTTPPDALLAWVREVETVLGRDWKLTIDAVAFGPVDVATTFDQWRAGWVHWWVLDPLSSVIRLGRDDALTGCLLSGLEDLGRTSGVVDVIPPTAQAELIAGLGAAQRHVVASGRHGFGIVDATPGRRRRGLARAWSPTAGSELMAAVDTTAVWMHPTQGLRVCWEDRDGMVRSVDSVDEVRLAGARVELLGRDDRTTIDGETARPVMWFMPGATRWRVRRIPEVVVWAKTLHGLRQACDLAATLNRPVELAVSALRAEIAATP